MECQTVYIETSVVSYLTARRSLDPIVAGRQAVTDEWWSLRRSGFETVISELVAQEAGAGDSDAAEARLEALAGIPSLPISDDAVSLAQVLVNRGPIPEEYSEDALHIALCAVNGIDYLMTWNCKHLANAAHRHRIEAAVESCGYTCPVICTPEELLEA